MSAVGDSFFDFDQPPLTNELISKLQNKLPDTDETNHQLEELKSLLRKESTLHLPDDDAFLLQLLRVRKYDIERAALLCRKFFTKFHNCDIFENMDIAIIQKAVDLKYFGILPSRDRDGCVVFVIFNGRWDPRVLPIKESFQVFLFTVLQCMRCWATQITGIKIIADYSNFSMAQMIHISPFSLWHGLDSIQNCIPFPLKACYMLNENAFFKYFWSILKVMLKKKIRDRIHFLGTNVSALKEAFPEDILFEDFSGSAGPFSSEAWVHLMKDFPEYFAYLKQHGYGKA